MRKLYSAAHLQEAYLLIHRLSHAGIEARVLNEHAVGAVGEIPFLHAFPEVWLVDADDEARARAIVREFEDRRADGPPRPCPSCGEENPGGFELCWRCGVGIEGR